MVGGETYVKKIPSMKVTDLASAVSPNSKQKIIGIRPGEKLHEQMIGAEDEVYTYEYDDYYKILPAIHKWCDDPNRIKDGKKVEEGFIYSSNTNKEWVSITTMREWIETNRDKIGKI